MVSSNSGHLRSSEEDEAKGSNEDIQNLVIAFLGFITFQNKYYDTFVGGKEREAFTNMCSRLHPSVGLTLTLEPAGILTMSKLLHVFSIQSSGWSMDFDKMYNLESPVIRDVVMGANIPLRKSFSSKLCNTAPEVNSSLLLISTNSQRLFNKV
ncbi:Hypothetical predicted protein [Octopus vulgaris]|uniref:Uncharacterized protein n=1 Tax=Octopus vulgaris TaxID=6645 RepID=A0AA36F3D1_OCTVU|nr:Hypothetical predicted protein [Octopus vulgaris]